MNAILVIVIVVFAILFGAFATWVYLVKIRRPKVIDEAHDTTAVSKNNDENRESVKEDIKERIEKNRELRDKLKEKLDQWKN